MHLSTVVCVLGVMGILTILFIAVLRLEAVLCNIIEINGENDLVECKRGKKYKNVNVEDVMRTMQQLNNVATVDLLGG